MNLLELPNIIDYNTYVETFERIINQSLLGAYYFCFKIYDFNNDNLICHRDLFHLFQYEDQYPLFYHDFEKSYLVRLFPF